MGYFLYREDAYWGNLWGRQNGYASLDCLERVAFLEIATIAATATIGAIEAIAIMGAIAVIVVIGLFFY